MVMPYGKSVLKNKRPASGKKTDVFLKKVQTGKSRMPKNVCS